MSNIWLSPAELQKLQNPHPGLDGLREALGEARKEIALALQQLATAEHDWHEFRIREDLEWR